MMLCMHRILMKSVRSCLWLCMTSLPNLSEMWEAAVAQANTRQGRVEKAVVMAIPDCERNRKVKMEWMVLMVLYRYRSLVVWSTYLK